MHRRAALLGAIWALTATAARAQQGALPVEIFEPRPGGTGVLDVATAPTLPAGGFAADLWIDYVSEPLALDVAVTGETRPSGAVIDSRLRLDLVAALGLLDGLSVGAGVPFLTALGEGTYTIGGRSAQDLSRSSLGDVRLLLDLDVLRVLLGIDRDSSGGLGLGLGVTTWLPSGDEKAFHGEGTVRWEPRLALSWRADAGFALAVNAGWHRRPKSRIFNVIAGDTIRWAAGGEAPLGLEGLGVEASVHGDVWLEDQPDVQDLSKTDPSRSVDPIEAVAAVRYLTPWGVEVAVGGGRGLTSGVGSPALRLFARVGFALPPDRGRASAPPDDDHDGVPDDVDVCPFDPENLDGVRDTDGCPEATPAVIAAAGGGLMPAPLASLPALQPRVDGDGDGATDDEDVCPAAAEDKDGIQDADGCPEEDADGDRVPDSDDRCPAQSEIFNGVADEDGCPDRADDADGDGVEDRVDVCPLEPENIDGVRDGDGCPEAPPPADRYDARLGGGGLAAPPLAPLEPLEVRLDADGDGIPSTLDACDDAPEDFDGFLDGDGCPDPDNDGDGVADDPDRCPLEAESVNGVEDWDGCPEVGPDADGDRVTDLLDVCPLEPETVDGVRDADGCPEGAPFEAVAAVAAEAPPPAPPPEPLPPLPVAGDLDGDGLAGDADGCPQEAEDVDGFQDADGCPDPDNDADGVLDAADRCPSEAETPNAYLDDDGCPDVIPQAQADIIGVVRGIQFRANSARVLPQSFRVLKKVKAALAANPRLRVEIAGHTDDRGPRDANIELSKRRALVVLDWLVAQGIDPARLSTRGYGPDRPIDSNKHFGGRWKNRRVELLYREVRADPKEAP